MTQIKIKEGEAGQKDQYAHFNTESLIKRTGISREKLSDAEKKGKVDKLIKDRLKQIVSEQKTIADSLKKIYNNCGIEIKEKERAKK